MERRKFLSWFGIGGLATYLPIAIAACSPQADNKKANSVTPNSTDKKPSKLDTTVREDGFVAIGTVEELDLKDQLVKKVNDVIVFKNPETSELIALKSLCTHQGCTVKWKKDKQNLACPCHGSAFGTDGTVIKGPASKPLDIYQVKEEDGIILVKLA